MSMLRSLSLLVFAPAFCAAQPPPGYYDPAQGLSGQAMKQALHDIIDDHAWLQYGGLWTAFQTTDVRPDGFLWDIYSDIPGGTPPYLYTLGTDQCGTYNGEGDCYNREHSFPSSWFNDAYPMYTDLFHPYPTDGWVNQKRGSLPYGVVGAIDWSGQNGTKVGAANVQGYTGTVCEPIDAYKGDLARSYFYLMTRYMDVSASWSSDMLVNGDLSPWAEYMLLQWHANDPVSAKEIDRNNAIFAIQQNRNPFIDHPEWVPYIWGPTAAIGETPRGSGFALVNDEVVLRDASLRGSNYHIVDASGRVAASGRLVDERTALPTLAPGLYVLVAEGQALRFVR